jgi:hypothetical protein
MTRKVPAATIPGIVARLLSPPHPPTMLLRDGTGVNNGGGNNDGLNQRRR